MSTSPSVVTFASCPVSYKVLRNPQVSGSGSYTQGYSESMTVAVQTVDLYNFLTWAGGKTYSILVSGVPVARIIPVSHPVFPWLLCQNLEWKLTGAYNASGATLSGMSGLTLNATTTAALNLVNYTWAQVTLTFSTVPYLTDGSTPFLVLNREIGGEVYTLAGQKLTFPSDGTLIDADAGVSVPTIVYAATVYQAPSVNDTGIAAAAAAPVNSATFLGFAAGYCRFDGVSSTVTVTAGNNTTYQTTFKFTYRPVPWNQYLRPNGVWEAPTNGGSYVYGTSDLNLLIQ